MMLVSIFVIATFIKIKDCRKPPGDLFLMIAIADLMLGFHWFTSVLGSKWSFLTP